MSNPHYREAAESLLSSVSPHHRTLTHSTSLNLVSDDLVAGHRPQGKMSTVRRFFCLFVTFDLLFTSLMWLICVMMRGDTLEQIVNTEILQYNVKTSLFDIVMVAVCRFIVLLLFYAVLYINNWSVIAVKQRLPWLVCGWVTQYNVKTSLFDIVMVAVCRFIVLPLFYAVLYINNWSVIALSTGTTCALLIAKVFVFDWPNAVQPVYEVFLILTSFTLAWGEAWFLDFRVLPQEFQAKTILESIVHHNASERTPLLQPHSSQQQSNYAESTVKWFSPVETPESSPRVRRPGEQIILTQEQYLIVGYCRVSNYTESTVKWFSPVETPEPSPRIRRPGEQIILTQEQIDEYKAQAQESMHDAWRIVNLPNWSLEKKGTRGDIVESRRTEQFGKVYRFTGMVEAPPKFLYEEFKDNITKLPEWNPTILKSELIKEVGPGIDLSYQVTAGGGRGIIAPRDFVILRCTAPLSRDGQPVTSDPYSYISSGVSVTVPGYPPHRDLVRGQNKVGCWYLKPRTVQTSGGKIETHTMFQWLMCCDLKGKIPQFVLDAAFATVMLDYIVHVRKFAAEAKQQGRF